MNHSLYAESQVVVIEHGKVQELSSISANEMEKCQQNVIYSMGYNHLTLFIQMKDFDSLFPENHYF